MWEYCNTPNIFVPVAFSEEIAGLVAPVIRGGHLSGISQGINLFPTGKLDTEISHTLSTDRLKDGPSDELCRALFARITETVMVINQRLAELLRRTQRYGLSGRRPNRPEFLREDFAYT